MAKYLPEDIHQRLEKWASFQGDESEAVIDEDDGDLCEDGPTVKVGRNDPCPCGSGKKFKKCCLH
jgi:uncharacterized protein YecA (UPF0149 family)